MPRASSTPSTAWSGAESEDNRGGEQDAISHTFHAFASTPWLGQVAWGDHDMFHSGDRSARAARFNVIAKAVSGGPVYLSELADHFKTDYVKGLCYGDGKLLRPLAPAAPLTEDLFAHLYEPRVAAAVAPLPNRCAMFVLYGTRRRGPDAKTTYERTLTPRDYGEASGMIQPYPGPWNAPEEGLLVYDWYAGSAGRMGKGFKVTVKGFDYRALHVSPIVNAWSVVGRVDKYLCAAGVRSITAGADELAVVLERSGPLGIWSGKGPPRSAGVVWEDRGQGLYVADLPVSDEPVTVRIRR